MGQHIEHVHTTDFMPNIWSAADIREEWPETADQVGDDQIGLMVAGVDGDGALLVGTVEQVYDKRQWALGRVIQRAKPDSPIFQ